MDRATTLQFIREAKAFARARRWNNQTLSRHLFNKNPYGFDRLIASLRGVGDGPPYVRVLDAVARFRELQAEAEEEEPVLA